MTHVGLTRHAGERLQQRTIPPFAIELLERFGTSVRSRGADKIFFDKHAKKRVSEYLGGARCLKLIEKLLDAYIVVSDDGKIITVGYR
ncbi:MAG: hypothetical protein AB7F96_12635 [Beijerinckiaceae bacterium]